MQDQRSSKTLVILLIIAGIIAVGLIAYLLGKNNSQTVHNYYNTTPTQTLNNSPEASMHTQTDLTSYWQSLSSDTLINLASEQDVFVDSNTSLHLVQTLDLTGDGVPEGIFSGNAGNSDITYIVLVDENGDTVFAQHKGKDGALYHTTLESVGRVMFQETYKILPSEHGFYTASLSGDDSGVVTCNPDGVSAYVWNPSASVFEWNQTLTAKYTTEVCG